MEHRRLALLKSKAGRGFPNRQATAELPRGSVAQATTPYKGCGQYHPSVHRRPPATAWRFQTQPSAIPLPSGAASNLYAGPTWWQPPVASLLTTCRWLRQVANEIPVRNLFCTPTVVLALILPHGHCSLSAAAVEAAAAANPVGAYPTILMCQPINSSAG